MTIVLGKKFSVEKMDFDLKELSTTLLKQRIHIFKVKNIHALKTHYRSFCDKQKNVVI